MPRDDRYKVSAAQEKRVARVAGARQHKGSGSGAKALDMHTATELIECKTVLKGNKQITIKASTWRDLAHKAAVQDKDPVLSIELDGLRLVLLPEANHYGTEV